MYAVQEQGSEHARAIKANPIGGGRGLLLQWCGDSLLLALAIERRCQGQFSPAGHECQVI